MEVFVAKKTITAADKITKKYGAHTWKKFGKPQVVPSVSTGSLILNEAIGEPNGWPEGAVIEVYGWQGAGKTLLTYLAIAEAQKQFPDKPCALIDAEKQFKYQAKWAQSIGVNVEELFVSPCATAEEAFDKLEAAILGEAEYDDKGMPVKVITPGDFSVIVVDSVSQLTPKSEVQAEMDGSTRQAAQAAAIGKGLRKLVSAMTLADSKTIVFFINQVRMAPGVMMGNPESRSGGNSLRFYATLICKINKISKSEQRDSKNKIVSHRVKVKLEKNKAGQLPAEAIEFTLNYDGSGVDNDLELFSIGKNNGCIDGKGWYTFIDPDTGIEDEEVGKFQESKFKSVLERHPHIKEKLIKVLKSENSNKYVPEPTEEELKAEYEEVKEEIKAEEATRKKGPRKKKKDVGEVIEINGTAIPTEI